METTQKKTAETLKITGNWEAQAKQLKSKYPQLTDADLKFETGMESELVSRLQSRLGKNRQEVIDILKPVPAEKV